MEMEGWRLALLVHGGLALLALVPAWVMLRRGGLNPWLALWPLLPVAGWPLFATLIAFRPWPALPPRPEKLHPRERLRRERAARQPASGKGA